MDKDRWNEITNIVDDLLETDDREKQRAILHGRCGEDKELRDQVLELLKSIKDSSDYWDSLFYSNRLLMNDLTRNYSESSFEQHIPVLNKDSQKEDEIPDQIGPYSIKKRIGYGGMSEVFLAARSGEKFNQNVALKLIRHSVGSHDQAKRFEQERVILSSLNHPNIARLFDGGISEDGRSYYVMEYIDGIPITDYCEKHRCSLSERLDLFKQVCKAVQYAHSNFIVHRDLKPQNLFVNKQGVVKVLDFGIAKLLDHNLNEQTMLETRVGLRMLSLKYASPEQITLERITTATDVYALGVLLYKLLTRSHPLPLDDKGLKETEHIIRYHEPERPSSVSTRWKERLKGDLDAIVLKALRKESSDRYESAKSMLEDIERHEDSLPVSARQDTIPYLTKKFVRRHSIPLLFTSVILALVIAFTFFYTTRITQEKQQAELQAQKAEQVTLFLMDMFEAGNPEETGGEVFNVRDLLARGEDMAEKLQGYPELKGRMYEVIGEINLRIGRYEKSETLLRSSLAIRKNLYDNYHPETISVYDKLGLLLIYKGEYDTADSILTRVLDIRENRLHSDGPTLATTLSNLAFVTRRKGEYENAEHFYRRSLELREEHLGNDHPLTIENMGSLGVILHNNGNYNETETLYREILERRENLLDPMHPDIAVSQNSLGALLMNTGQYQEADSLFREALYIRRKLYGENHPDVALTMNNLGLSHLEQNEFSEASEYIEKALDIRMEQLGGNHVNTAISKFTMAKLMLETNRPDSALQLYEDALDVFSEKLSEDHSFSARTLVGIGSAYLAKGDLEQAEPYFERGYSQVQNIHSETSLEFALASMQYASYLKEKGDIDQSQKLLEDAFQTFQIIEGRQESERQEDVLALLNQTYQQDE